MINHQYYRAHNIREGVYGPPIIKVVDTEILEIIFYWKSEGTLCNIKMFHLL